MKYLIFISLVLLSCQGVKHSTNYQLLIEGNWCLAKKNSINEVNYGQIKFDTNGIVILFSRADTLYSYKYKIENDDLLIFRFMNKDTIRTHILKLTTDSLVFSSLIEKQTKQTYYRCDKK